MLRTIKHIVGFIILCFFFVNLISRFNKNRFAPLEEKCNYLKSLSFNGIVLKRYRDYDRQGVFTVEIKTIDSVFTLRSYPVYLESYIQVNDSIVKEKGSFDIRLMKYFNRDSIAILSRNGFDCDYWEKNF